jgi:prepilin-type N-terminal cleavage/methylation domain-containing protein
MLLGLANPSDERGFTLIEVLVAMVILLVGVLGVVSIFDAANAQTASAAARVGATNLAREIIEDAHDVDYQRLTDTDIVGQLRNSPTLAGTLSGSTWTITRKGVTYTVAVDTCIYDDASDKAGAHSGGDYCSTSAQPAAGATGNQLDLNPDDFRRVDLTITWRSGNANHTQNQTALIVNPSGGLGPRITSFLPNPLLVQSSGTNSASFAVVSTYADTLHWTADDGNSSGNATGGPTSWAIDWALGPVNTPTVYDGTYTVGAQAFDERGIPGDLRAANVIINRRAPFAPPAPVGGGYDTRAGTIVDLQWSMSVERDVLGYRVYRDPDGVPGDSDDSLVCPASGSWIPKTTLYCYDNNPPGNAAAHYYVVGVDLIDASPNGPGDVPSNEREGDPRPIDVAALSDNAARPEFPNNEPPPSATLVNGQPVFTWDAASDSDGDGIQFYRIYRDGDPASGYLGRYDRTNTSSPTYTDPTPGTGTTHTYWVTAVDGHFNESDPIGPVTVSIP